MPIRKASKINLLPQDDFESSTLGRVLKWALSSFRVMVIVTELVVMGAFLSRFWLDARNSDLNEEINVKKSQVKAYSAMESEFREYQKKLSIAKVLFDENQNSTIFQEVALVMPKDITMTTYQVTGTELQIKAVSLSELAIAQFLANLSENEKLSDVSLSQVASSVDNSFVTTFTINAKIGGGKI